MRASIVLGSLALLVSGVAHGQGTQTLELPRFESSAVKEAASLSLEARTRYEPAGSMPSSERTQAWRVALDYLDLGDRLQVERARRWGPAPRAAKAPADPGPAAPRAPGAAAPRPKKAVERTLPCEGQSVHPEAFPELAWAAEHPLQALLPKGPVAVGESWTVPLDAAPVLLGGLAAERITQKVKQGKLTATFEGSKDGEAVVAFSLKLTYAKPSTPPFLQLDFAAELEVSATLRLGAQRLQLVVDGELVTKEHYTSGAPPDAKSDSTLSIHREFSRVAAKPN